MEYEIFSRGCDNLHYYVEDLQFNELANLLTFNNLNVINVKGGRKPINYIQLYSGFDIETTNIVEDSHKVAYMYIWQMSFNDYVLLGRTWDSFILTIDILKRYNTLNRSKRIIIWIANLSFEFQFLRKRFNITKVFAKEKRQPLYAIIDDCIELRDPLPISGGSLAQLAKDYTVTQKLVGELDYSVLRNSETPMKDSELQYCINDVVILREWSEFIFNNFIIPKKYIPLTKTGILRRQVKDNAPNGIHKVIEMCMPSERLYGLMMKYLFRGGYVHANICHTDYILENVTSIDLTSSYPAQMNHGYFPMGKFYKSSDTDIDTFTRLIENECCIFGITFYNIESTTNHSIESKSKCIELVNPSIDNGRVSSADKMTVFINEIDYSIYKKFYRWDDFKIHFLYHTVRGKLPSYLLDVLNHEYLKKAELKKSGKKNTTEYAISKSNVNSAFGMTVTRMVEKEVIYEDGEWEYDTSGYCYYEEIKKLVLLPQWGVYVTSHARNILLSMVYEISQNCKGNIDDIVYNDTDSIKLLNYGRHKHIIEEFNNRIVEKNKELFDNPLFYDLGTFDDEGTSERFKTLGAKRYISEKNGEIEQTIAGLPKKVLKEYCSANNIDVFEFFSSGMNIDVKSSGKLTTCYNDEAHTDMVAGAEMKELSSVCLYSIPFKMTLDKYYMSLINELRKDEERYEERIY